MADERGRDGEPVELSEDETAIMLGCFAGAPPEQLAASTGLSRARVAAIVARLARLGLIDEAATPWIPLEASGDAGAASVEDPPTARDSLVELIDTAMLGLVPGGQAVSMGPVPAPAPAPVPDPDDHARARAREPEDGAELDAEDVTGAEGYRKKFATELKDLPAAERVARASKASGAELCALCFDPDPAVVTAIFGNPGATLDHARLVAFHHRTSRGLEEVAGRPSLANDGIVQRRLLRNPALGESMLRRLMATKRLLEVHKLALDHDAPERTRASARTLFRARFATSSPEERVDVIWATEGRVLAAMAGLTFDARTTSILCSRSYASIIMVQSLARFPATPPQLIAHLLRQPLVKRQAHLKNQLLAHPNVPSDAKKQR